MIFDKVPENLRAQPTLSVLVNAAKPVNDVARLTYLSRGLSWAADYVAVFDEAQGDTVDAGLDHAATTRPARRSRTRAPSSWLAM